MKIKELDILGWDYAMEAMRYPFMSHNNKKQEDIDLAKRLINAGVEHRKFLRQITVHMKVAASMTFWFEFDTHKIGVTSNSESFWNTIGKQDKLDAKNFLVPEKPQTEYYIALNKIIEIINKYKEEENPHNTILRYLVPQSVIYQRSITMTGEALFNIIQQRHNHRLQEWKTFVNMCFDLMLPREKEIFELALKKEKP